MTEDRSLIYCYRCNAAVTPYVAADPDRTIWSCPTCGTVLDENFTDDEIEWANDDTAVWRSL